VLTAWRVAVLCGALQLMRSPELQGAAAALHKAMGMFASVFLPNVVVSTPQGEPALHDFTHVECVYEQRPLPSVLQCSGLICAHPDMSLLTQHLVLAQLVTGQSGAQDH
jgi:hypothetical protein